MNVVAIGGPIDTQDNLFWFLERFQWQKFEHLREAVRILFQALDCNRMVNINPNESVSPDEMEQIKACIASNPETPPAVLAYLADANSTDVLERIAENPNTSAETLWRLAYNAESRVRAALASNDNTPFDVLEMLSQDESTDVRWAVAENPRMPVHILNSLLMDSNPYVSDRAGKTLSRMADAFPFRAIAA